MSIHVFAYGLWIFARYHVGKHLFDRSYACIRELLVALETLRDCSCGMPCGSMISLLSCRKNDGSKPLTCALQTFLLDRSRCCLQSLQNRPAAEHGEGFVRSHVKKIDNRGACELCTIIMGRALSLLGGVEGGAEGRGTNGASIESSVWKMQDPFDEPVCGGHLRALLSLGRRALHSRKPFIISWEGWLARAAMSCRRVSWMLVFSATADLARAMAVVTPIGPFCPFRSAACAANGPLGIAMDKMTSMDAGFMPRFAAEMARINLQMQTGEQPDTEKVKQLANELYKAEEDWRTMLTRMRMTDDFQSREYYKMTEAWTLRQGESLETMGLMMRWQADNMKAFATGGMPLPPPPGIDLDKLAQQQQSGGAPSNMMTQVSSSQSITAQPFTPDSAAFESDVVRTEYEQLCRDHAGIIKLGESYGSFDWRGKLAFIDSLEAVEGRRDTFYARFQLMGALNSEFEEQTSAFLESMGMSATIWREVLGEAHGIMRKEAEEESGGLA